MARMHTMPTERSMPAVITTSDWAMATSARSTPLFAAVWTTLATAVAENPLLSIAGCLNR